MGFLFIVPLMVGLLLRQVPEADRPVLTVAPDAKVRIRHMKDGDRAYIKVESGGVAFEAIKLRLDIGNALLNVDVAAEGVRFEHRTDDRIETFVVSEMTVVGRQRKKE